MSDLAHQMGLDLSVDATGDLALVDGPDWVRERVLRRLLTNPRDYVWQQEYGGGLAGFVGQPVSAATIEAVIRAQMLLETAVARRPLPQVSIADMHNGIVAASVNFADTDTQQMQGADLVIGGGV